MSLRKPMTPDERKTFPRPAHSDHVLSGVELWTRARASYILSPEATARELARMSPTELAPITG